MMMNEIYVIKIVNVDKKESVHTPSSNKKSGSRKFKKI